MYRIILVDDEPLILAGIASLICWEDYHCTIVGKATNGPGALELIQNTMPDIVITDIRMPVMNGLELIEECRKRGYSFSFLVLTNLEEFSLARKALSLGAVDYLVKLNLEPEALIQALRRAAETCDRMESHQNRDLYNALLKDSELQLEQVFFRKLILGGAGRDFTVPEGLSEKYRNAFVLQCSMQPETIRFDVYEPYDYTFIHQQLCDILSRICSRYLESFCLLSLSDDTVLLVAAPGRKLEKKGAVSELCQKINGALSVYFGLKAIFGISPAVLSLSELPAAAAKAAAAMKSYYYDSHSPVIFYEGQSVRAVSERDFNINLLKHPIASAILQNDDLQLRIIFRELFQLFEQYHPDHSQAVSACLNLYTYLDSLFQNEGNAYSHIFPDSLHIAQQLKQLGSLRDILIWLESFCDQLCSLLSERRERPMDKLVTAARQYVQEHCREKLTLSDIAEQLNISPGHLSNTFRKYTDMTLSDYIAQVKVQEAKLLIDTHRYLIYEVADLLGFDNAYYFSKVFRKVTGISPREYEQSSHSQLSL